LLSNCSWEDGEIVATYDKSHLVPFGEYLPFPSFWKLLGIKQFVPGTNGWAPGTTKRLVTPPGLPSFIALICYEAIFSGDLDADPAIRELRGDLQRRVLAVRRHVEARGQAVPVGVHGAGVGAVLPRGQVDRAV
jgi:predicted amidohydrolase